MHSKGFVWILMGMIVCVLICAFVYFYNAPTPQEPVSEELFLWEWERELQAVPLNGIVELSDVFAFEWDSVEIINSPLGLEDFDWEEISSYDEALADGMASGETISALIFYSGGQVVDTIVYNYANPGAIVFRAYRHNGFSDVARYAKAEAKFQATYIGDFEEIVYLPAD